MQIIITPGQLHHGKFSLNQQNLNKQRDLVINIQSNILVWIPAQVDIMPNYKTLSYDIYIYMFISTKKYTYKINE